MKAGTSFANFKGAVFFSLVLLVNTSIAQNLIVNGNFSAGNTGFYTTNFYCNSAGCLEPYVYNAYSIGPNPVFFHQLFVGADHTSGTGNMLIVNGGLFSDIVWSQNVNVLSNSTYSFSAWVSSIYLNNTAALGFSINSVSQGSIAAPTSLNTWQLFSTLWNSGSATTASIVIRALNTSVNTSNDGVDFGLDDLSFSSTTIATSLPSYGDLDSNVKIYPNPTNHSVSIKIEGVGTVSLFDLRGIKLIDSLSIQHNGVLELKDYPSGVYFLELKSKDFTKCLRIVKTE